MANFLNRLVVSSCIIASLLVADSLKIIAAERVSTDSPMPKYLSTYHNATLAASIGSGKLDNGRKIVTILVDVYYSGDVYGIGPIGTKPMEVALRRIRALPNFLPEYEIVLELFDDICSDPDSISGFIEPIRANNVSSRIALAGGSSCIAFGQRIQGMVAKNFNYVVIITSGSTPELSADRKTYSSLFVIGPPFEYSHIGIMAFCGRMGWKKIAIIVQAVIYDVAEIPMLKEMERQNISLLYMGKVRYGSEDAEEHENLVLEMMKREPRVIYLCTYNPVPFACILYKYGYYGPNFVIFTQTYNYFDENSPPPDFLPWCTSPMLKAVQQWFIFAGEDNKNNAFDNFTDSTGTTNKQLDDILRDEIVDGDKNRYWYFNRGLAYDNALYPAFVLDQVERKLNKRNETLSDWYTTTERFQKHGAEFADLVKQSMFELDVKGMKADIGFDPTTTMNTRGRCPVSFAQVQITNDSSTKLVNIGIFNDLANPVVIFPNKMVWRTVDGLPPPDSVRVLVLIEPTIPLWVYATLVVIASVEVCSFAIRIAFAYIRFTKTPPDCRRIYFSTIANVLQLGANTLLLGTIFAMPANVDAQLALNCQAIVVLAVIGFGLSFSLTLAKLEYANWFVLGERTLSAELKWSRISALCGAAGISALQVALISAWIGIFPMFTTSFVRSTVPSKIDPRVAYAMTLLQCSSNGTTDLIIAIGCVFALLLLRICYLAYVRRSSVIADVPDIAVTCVVGYAKVLIFVAGGLAGAIYAPATPALAVVCAITTLVFCGLDAVLLTRRNAIPIDDHQKMADSSRRKKRRRIK